MDVQFSEEQLLLRDSILGQAEKLSPSSVSGYDDFDDELLWDRLAAAGALALGLPEELGGAGSISDAAIVATALGRALAPAPYLGCAVLPAQLLAATGADPELVAAIASGQRRIAVALDAVTGAIGREDGAALAWDAAGAEAALAQGADGRLVALALGPPTPGVDLTRTSGRLREQPQRGAS